MNEGKRNGASGGVGFLGLLTIAFVVLKLTKVIAWSWLWVLSPIWITTAIVVVGGIIFVIASVVGKKG